MKQEQIKETFYNQCLNVLKEKQKKEEISNWIINKEEIMKKNIYLEKNYKIESILEAEKETLDFRIFLEKEENIYDYNFNIDINSNIEEFKRELKNAIFLCSFSKNKKFEIPSKDDKLYEDKDIDYDLFYNKKFINDFNSESLNLFISQIIEKIKKIIEEENKKEIKIEMNYLEFFSNISKNFLETSIGIKKNIQKNSTYLEFAITGIDTKTKKEFEHITYEQINNIYNFEFEKFIKKQIQFAKDSLIAGINNEVPTFKGIIILTDAAAIDFFVPHPQINPIITHCSARLKFMKISKYEINNKITNSKFDKLTIYSNPFVKENTKSIAFDDLGISSKKICLIENGIVKNFLASKQYADYINIKASGPLGIIEILEGNREEKKLFEENEFIEIISFAWFNPDSSTGDFSAEIRLGYLHKNGNKIPFKGGLFTGNVFKIIEELELSKEIINSPGYLGPKTLKFYKGEIIGN